MKRIILMSSFIILFLGCTPEAKPIDYGSDACAFCEMTIVDQQHAAELVTKKGKVYKYDSIECLLHGLEKMNQDDIAIYLIDDYAAPGKFTDALSATYLVSENLPSPMGANLSGFSQKADAVKTQREKTGTLFTWEQIKEKF